MSDSFLFKCEGCGGIGNAKDTWIGKKVKCPMCGHASVIQRPTEKVPDKAPAVAAVAAAPPAAKPAPTKPKSDDLLDLPPISMDIPPIAMPAPVAAAHASEPADTLHDLRPGTAKTRWEHKIVCHELSTDADASTKLNDEMNLLGEEGWECAGITTAPTNGARACLWVTYKRPRS